MNLLKNKDLMVGLLLALLGLIFLVALIPFGIVEPRKVKYIAMSPSFYPRLVAIALLLFGLAISVRAYFQGYATSEADPSWRQDAWLRVGLVFIFLTAMALLLGLLGFIISSAIAIATLCYLAGERRPYLIALLAIITPLALYYFFVKVALIPIPAGLLKSLLVGG
jgi:putative tricarboxylic transport membrane protein